MKIEIEITDEQIKQLTESFKHRLGYNVVDAEKLCRFIFDDVLMAPIELLEYEDGLSGIDSETLADWGLEVAEEV